MTDSNEDQPGTEVAVHQTAPSAPLAPQAARPTMLDAQTDSWIDASRGVFWLADQISRTEFVPKGLRGNAAATAAAILHGRELGLPPMTSLAGQHVIEGRTGLSAELMRALVLDAGHDIEIVETTAAVCTVRGRRKGSQNWSPDITWTIGQANSIGLGRKDNWKNHPRRMLQARATSELCQLIFPDVLHGMQTPDELEDGTLVDDGQTVGSTVTDPTASTTRVSRQPRKSAPAAVASKSSEPAPPPPPRNAIEPPAPRGASGPVNEPAAPPADESDQEPPPGDPGPAQPAAEAVPSRGGKPSTSGQWRMIPIMFSKFGVTDDAERHYLTGVLAGLDHDVDSTKDLTLREASKVIDTLQQLLKDTPTPSPDQDPPVAMTRAALDKHINDVTADS